jgi:hypothetical protein
MTKPFEELTQLNKLIHEPVRLAIMTALSACNSAVEVGTKTLVLRTEFKGV